MAQPRKIPAIADKLKVDCNLVRELLAYDPETGIFTWRERPRSYFTSLRNQNAWNARNSGVRAGSVNAIGYRSMRIGKKAFLEHRLAWLYVYGRMPIEIDHINGVRSDNRIANLRECTRAENSQNHSIKRNNKSGVVGVSWSTSDKRWIAQIAANGARYRIGAFLSKDDAREAYLEAKKRLHTFNPIPRWQNNG